MISLFGGRLRISFFVPLLAAVAVFSPDAPFFLVAVTAAMMHELAHLVLMRVLGARFVRLSLYPFGADICADTSVLSYKAEIAVFLSGPVVSLLLCLFSLLFYRVCGGGMYLLAFCAANFLFFFVNILPVRGLDGGRALYCTLCDRLDRDRALRIFDIISTAFFGVLCFFAMVMIFASGYNLSLAFICCYLFISEYVRSKCAESRLVLG